jgi:hypothetical protein
MIEPSFFIRDSPSHGVSFGQPGSGPDAPDTWCEKGVLERFRESARERD